MAIHLDTEILRKDEEQASLGEGGAGTELGEFPPGMEGWLRATACTGEDSWECGWREDAPGCGGNMEGLVLGCRGVYLSWNRGSRVPRRKIQDGEKQSRVKEKEEQGRFGFP